MKLLAEKEVELVDYLCEDRSTQSLDHVFNTIKTFRDLFIKALKVCNKKYFKNVRRFHIERSGKHSFLEIDLSFCGGGSQVWIPEHV